jgi:hypothetical protein
MRGRDKSQLLVYVFFHYSDSPDNYTTAILTDTDLKRDISVDRKMSQPSKRNKVDCNNGKHQREKKWKQWTEQEEEKAQMHLLHSLGLSLQPDTGGDTNETQIINKNNNNDLTIPGTAATVVDFVQRKSTTTTTKKKVQEW